MSQTENPSAAAAQEFSRFKEKASGEKQIPYEKLMKLFTGKYEKDFHERQIAAIHKIVKKNRDGLPVSDLIHIDPLIRFILSKVEVEKETIFVEPLCHLIRLFTIPLKKSLASEELKSVIAISQLIKLFGTILSSEHEALVQAANDAIGIFASDPNNENPLSQQNQYSGAKAKEKAPSQTLKETKASQQSATIHQSKTGHNMPKVAHQTSPTKKLISDASEEAKHLSYQYFPATYNNQIIDNSGVIPHVAAALKMHETGKSEIVQALLETISTLTERKINTIAFHSTSLMSVLIRLLNRDYQERIVFLTVEIIWNIFEHNPLSRTDFGSKGGILTLRELFIRCLTEGYRVKDKELRNDIVILSNLLAQIPSQRHAFFDSGFLETALQICTAGELQKPYDIVKPFTITSSKEDYEMKRLLLFFIQLLCGQEECIKLINGFDLVAVLLMYINHTASALPHVNKYSRPQLQSLQLHALTILAYLIPFNPRRFEELDGNHILLTYIMEHSNEEFRLPALRLLLHTSHLFRSKLGSDGAIYMMLSLFKDMGNSEIVRTYAISAISQLCMDSEQNQSFFGKEGGVNTVLMNMNFRPDPSLRTQDMFVTCVIDCVWNAIVGHRRNETRFLTQQGVDSIFDLLENCPDYMKSLVLGCLTDLMKNPQTPDLAHGWKSSRSRLSFAEVLIDLWVKEDGKQLEYEAAAGDETKKKEHEYMRSIHRDTLGHELKPTLSSEIIESASGIDVRVKIYSLLNSIGFDKFDYIDRTYKVKLDLISNYPFFQEGEIIQDVLDELREEGIRPTTPDENRLDVDVQERYSFITKMQDQQRQIVADRNEAQLTDERRFLESMKSISSDAAKSGPVTAASRIQAVHAEHVARQRRKMMLKRAKQNPNSSSPELTIKESASESGTVLEDNGVEVSHESPATLYEVNEENA